MGGRLFSEDVSPSRKLGERNNHFQLFPEVLREIVPPRCSVAQCGSWIPQKEQCAGRLRNERKVSWFLPWGCLKQKCLKGKASFCLKDFPSSILLVYLVSGHMSRECSGTNT